MASLSQLAGTNAEVMPVRGELETARQVVANAMEALGKLQDLLDPSLALVACQLAECQGRIVFTGMGKSGIAARKIASTFASIGKPSLFLHPADAAHGDLGKMCAGDMLVAISVSGSTRSLDPLLQYARLHSILVVAITARPLSPLGLDADYVLAVPVVEEGGPVASVPMASTIATIALGDALATLVANRNRFGESDLAILHPAGRIGQRLRPLRMLMHAGERMPLVSPEASGAEVVAEITRKGFGITGVADPVSGQLLGVITDGDLRRNHDRIATSRAADLLHADPLTLSPSGTAAHALDLARSHRVTTIFLVEPSNGVAVGLIDLQDLLRVSID
jgi:arabinose-5-phosphate isomerase